MLNRKWYKLIQYLYIIIGVQWALIEWKIERFVAFFLIFLTDWQSIKPKQKRPVPFFRLSKTKKKLNLACDQWFSVPSNERVMVFSQQGVWVHAFLDTQTLKKNPSGHPFCLCGISRNLNLKLIIEFFHIIINPLTLFNDIMPYFDEFIHVYGWKMSI